MAYSSEEYSSSSSSETYGRSSRSSERYGWDDDDYLHQSKRAKSTITKTQGIDRISDLPDGIILDILSRLPVMEDVIQTSALSRRWQYLWTSVPTLYFSRTKLYSSKRSYVIKERRQEFASFISNTLIQCHHTKLKRFRLSFDNERCFTSQLNLWIRYALGANVEELDLHLPGYHDYDHPFELPQYLFINSSITNLKLTTVRVAPNLSVDWKVLNRLTINYVELNNEVIDNIMLGSPVLEFIELIDCFGFTRLDITSKSITSLVLNGFGVDTQDKHDAILKISAPHILSLDIRGSLWLRKLEVLDLSSLVRANLDFKAPFLIEEDSTVSSLYKDLWKGLIQCLGHVNELAIGHCGIKVLTRLDLEGLPSLLSKCTTLILNGLEKDDFPALAKLLQHSPALKSLFIQPKSSGNLYFYNSYFEYHSDGYIDDDNVIGGNYWESKKTQFECLHQSLKNVKIVYDFERDDECELIQFLLENASVLEKMIIDADIKGERLSSTRASLLKVTRKLLLQIPRASEHAVLLLEGFQHNESY